MRSAAPTITANILKRRDGVLNNKMRSIGKDRPAIIEEIETIPVVNSIVRKTPMQLAVSKG